MCASVCGGCGEMTIDLNPSMSQSVRTTNSSFSSSNGNEDSTPLHGSAAAAFSNGDDYDSDSSSLAPQ